MRRLAGGVSVITAGDGDARTGLTVTSAISLSMDPPTMMVSVNRACRLSSLASLLPPRRPDRQ